MHNLNLATKFQMQAYMCTKAKIESITRDIIFVKYWKVAKLQTWYHVWKQKGSICDLHLRCILNRTKGNIL